MADMSRVTYQQTDDWQLTSLVQILQWSISLVQGNTMKITRTDNLQNSITNQKFNQVKVWNTFYKLYLRNDITYKTQWLNINILVHTNHNDPPPLSTVSCACMMCPFYTYQCDTMRTTNLLMHKTITQAVKFIFL